MDETSHPRVVAVVASPRRDGNTVALVDAALERLTALGCRCETIDVCRVRIAPCDAHDDCAERETCVHDADDAAAAIDAAYDADGLILASPVYYENVSAQMKLFMDRCYFPYTHERRLAASVVGLITVAAETGLEDTLAAMRRFVGLSTDRDVPTFDVSGIADERGAAAADPELRAAARHLADEMARYLLPVV